MAARQAFRPSRQRGASVASKLAKLAGARLRLARQAMLIACPPSSRCARKCRTWSPGPCPSRRPRGRRWVGGAVTAGTSGETSAAHTHTHTNTVRSDERRVSQVVQSNRIDRRSFLPLTPSSFIPRSRKRRITTLQVAYQRLSALPRRISSGRRCPPALGSPHLTTSKTTFV